MKILRNLLSITPFLIVAIGLIFYFIYLIFTIDTNESEGWEIIVYLIIFVSFIVVITLDILLKSFIVSKKNVIIIQFIIIAIYAIFRFFPNVKQTLLLPQGFSKPYVTIIYNVENEPKLPHRLIPFRSPIRVNEDGYVLTSSKLKNFNYGNGKKKFAIKEANKVEIGQKESEYGFINFEIYSIKTPDKKYPFLTFKIQAKEDCCGWSATEVNNHFKNVESYLKNHLN